MTKSVLCVVAAAMLVCGCRQSPPAPAQKPVQRLADLPIDLHIEQRTTQAVPGTDGTLQITIDDITDDQVIVSLAAESALLVPPTSFSPGTARTFTWGDVAYQLQLTELHNAIVGDDVADFTISSATDMSISETEKIERLIGIIRDMDDAVFIRNDTEHSADEAAQHLRRKWQAQADDIETAESFIDNIASRSSITGQPYQIRKVDGTIVDSSAFLRQQLAQIEASH